jgi:hypothetical protein
MSECGCGLWVCPECRPDDIEAMVQDILPDRSSCPDCHETPSRHCCQWTVSEHQGWLRMMLTRMKPGRRAAFVERQKRELRNPPRVTFRGSVGA